MFLSTSALVSDIFQQFDSMLGRIGTRMQAPQHTGPFEQTADHRAADLLTDAATERRLVFLKAQEIPFSLALGATCLSAELRQANCTDSSTQRQKNSVTL